LSYGRKRRRAARRRATGGRNIPCSRELVSLLRRRWLSGVRDRIHGLPGRWVASSPRGRRRMAPAPAANTSATGGGRYLFRGRWVASSPRGRRRMATAPAANTSATGGGRYLFRGKLDPPIVSRTRLSGSFALPARDGFALAGRSLWGPTI